MKNILLTIGKTRLELKLLDTPTAQAVLQNLPFASRAQLTAGEVYFETPIQATAEADAKDVIEAGEIVFCCEGSSIAIAYGPTAVSEGDEIRLAFPCNIWAKTSGDLSGLKNVQAGDMVFIEVLPE